MQKMLMVQLLKLPPRMTRVGLRQHVPTWTSVATWQHTVAGELHRKSSSLQYSSLLDPSLGPQGARQMEQQRTHAAVTI